MRTAMMNTLRLFVLLIVCGTLQGCIWWSYSGSRDDSLGTDATSGYIVVTKQDMSAEQAMEKASNVLTTGWAPLDPALSTPTTLTTVPKAVHDKTFYTFLPFSPIPIPVKGSGGPTAQFRVTAELIASSPVTIDVRVSGQPFWFPDSLLVAANPEQLEAMRLGIRDSIIGELKKRVEQGFWDYR